MQVDNLGRKKYVFVVVDDSSRFTWVNFITHDKGSVSSNVVGSVGTSVRCTSETFNLV